MIKVSEKDFDLQHWRMLASGLPQEGAVKAFATEEDAEDRLSYIVWPEGRYCPKCGSTDSWPHANRNLFECSDCGRQFSLKSVSDVRGLKVPLHRLLWAAERLIVTFAVEDLRSQQTVNNFKKTLSCSYSTAFSLRAAMYNELKTVRGGFWGQLVCLNEMDESHYDDDRLQELFDRYPFDDD